MCESDHFNGRQTLEARARTFFTLYDSWVTLCAGTQVVRRATGDPEDKHCTQELVSWLVRKSCLEGSLEAVCPYSVLDFQKDRLWCHRRHS